MGAYRPSGGADGRNVAASEAKSNQEPTATTLCPGRLQRPKPRHGKHIQHSLHLMMLARTRTNACRCVPNKKNRWHG